MLIAYFSISIYLPALDRHARLIKRQNPANAAWLADACPHLVLNGKIDEVGVHQHLIRRPQLRIVLKEQRCGYFLAADRGIRCVTGPANVDSDEAKTMQDPTHQQVYADVC
jgi:hypothetical protein